MINSGCGTPAKAQAYVFNATVVPPAALGYLTLWPQGAARPVVSTLNAFDGAITSNMAIVPAANGTYCWICSVISPHEAARAPATEVRSPDAVAPFATTQWADR